LSYDQQILKVLTIAGESGVSAQAIAKHVYNMNCTFFVQPDFDEIRTYVQQYLLRNSKSQQSLIESTGRRGYYRLNTEGSADARQLLLQFRDEKEEEREEEKPQQDLSLDLFD
jgi:alkanesulfonate monooxygenase SsuD/methylene tetrahydromethanopterin reductase-like flavin-dependent oxidoreductase (luciferase family)